MTQMIFARILAAGLFVGVSLPAGAQDAQPIQGPAPVSGGSGGAAGIEADRPLVDQVEAVLADPIESAVKAALADLHNKARSFVGKRREAAVASFYAERGDEPAWIENGAPSARALAVAERILGATADGLDPRAFSVPQAPAGSGAGDLAAYDVALSSAVVAFSEEASGGRIEPNSISPKFITRKPDRVDPIGSLRQVASATDAVAVLDGFNPPHEAFRRLKAMLAEVRGRPAEAMPEPIPEGKSLKPGMRDPRIVLLRERLNVPAPAVDPIATGTLPVADPDTTGAAGPLPTPGIAPDADLYDDALVEAVKTFQKGAGLLADGIVGPRTVAVLNGVDRDEEGQIVANMEMWRWMPRDLGREHVFVNIPEFMVRVVRHGVQTHETRVVVGTQTNQTPVFSDEMEYLVVNPYWHVPESIRMKEMLPAIQADPSGFFRRHGYEAVWNGQVIDPSRVVWDENAVKFVAIRQPPSEANALGRIKFMFPNQHAVYLHDTPSRKLFQRDWRSYSHGCVRVDDPMEFARAILEGEPDLDVGKLEAMFGGQERRVDLSQRIRVHIAYFTVWVDDAGVLQMRDDLYGHTGRVKKALEQLSAAPI